MNEQILIKVDYKDNNKEFIVFEYNDGKINEYKIKGSNEKGSNRWITIKTGSNFGIESQDYQLIENINQAEELLNKNDIVNCIFCCEFKYNQEITATSLDGFPLKSLSVYSCFFLSNTILYRRANNIIIKFSDCYFFGEFLANTHTLKDSYLESIVSSIYFTHVNFFSKVTIQTNIKTEIYWSHFFDIPFIFKKPGIINNESEVMNGIFDIDIHSTTFHNDFVLNNRVVKHKLNFSNVTFIKKTNIINTVFCESVSFWKSTFLNANFERSTFHKEPDFRFNKCENIRLDGTRFIEGVNFWHSNIEKAATRETARVIKHEYIKIDNKVEALKWHAKEMELHLCDLSDKHQHTSDEKIDAFILLIEKWVSHYGISVRRITFWIVGLFIVYVLALFYLIDFNFSLSKAMYYFFKPFADKDDGIWLHLIVSVKTAAFAFLLYELQKTLRKFSRKL